MNQAHGGGRPIRGVCHICGCTEFRACPGSCSWVDATQTLCDRCVWISADEIVAIFVAAGADAAMLDVFDIVPRSQEERRRLLDDLLDERDLNEPPALLEIRA